MSAKEIIQQITTLPESQQWQVVLAVLQLLQNQTSEISMATPGEPMSMDVFKLRLEKAEQDIEARRVYTTDEVRKRLDSWK